MHIGGGQDPRNRWETIGKKNYARPPAQTVTPNLRGKKARRESCERTREIWSNFGSLKKSTFPEAANATNRQTPFAQSQAASVAQA